MINRFHKKKTNTTPPPQKKTPDVIRVEDLEKNKFQYVLKAVFLPDESGGDPTFVNSLEFETLANFGDF